MTLLILVATLMSAAQGSTSLSLICAGGGSANKPDVRTGSATDNWGNNVQGQSFGQRPQEFDDAVSIRIDGEVGKIRMPRSMLPPIHGGDNGWFDLRGIKVTSEQISANAAVSVLNKPKVLIDRMAGTVTIDGKSGHFLGQCQAFDQAAAKPKF